ncbi:hypothetical protein Gogos_016938 [Gossypium gossypioides]|uniref:RNase H type-1 domain-containing protein n=1 Tax=Gossypium gossypioides TaxID=34282 RepID=A0A7J9B972_GOSGO|nr:hypothetical protein [Gossypium gossypioides]
MSKVSYFCGGLYPYISDCPVTVKTWALRLGLWLGLECATIEDDSLKTMKKAKSISKDKLEIGDIVINIQQCKERFQQINFRHNSRPGNSLAHHLAKASLKKGEDIYLVGGVPNYVRRAEERRRQWTSD